MKRREETRRDTRRQKKTRGSKKRHEKTRRDTGRQEETRGNKKRQGKTSLNVSSDWQEPPGHLKHSLKNE